MAQELNIVNHFSTRWTYAYQSQSDCHFRRKILPFSNLHNASRIEPFTHRLNHITWRSAVMDFPQVRNGEQGDDSRNGLAVIVPLFCKPHTLPVFDTTKARLQIRLCGKELNQLRAAHSSSSGPLNNGGVVLRAP